IRLIYYKKGFRGKELDKIVEKITSDEQLWLQTMMREELGLTESESVNPFSESLIVGGSALVASFIPVIPFAFLPVSTAVPTAFIASAAILFFGGAYKAKITVGDWKKSGLEMLLVGSLAAIAGYIIGQILGARIS
ncbi:VIT1/CCC1 transporter family protein, partial [Candidatus Micrarchaeota archaeon]|nr:VIT1/CCC1 transporter family protein [Candidatus Micrarchaeota archaeon]